MENTSDLAQFRNKVYYNFNKRGDTLMELLDTLCSHTQAKLVVELSLQSCFRRTHSAIFKALDAYRPGQGGLVHMAGPHLPPPEQGTFWLVGLDVTSQAQAVCSDAGRTRFCLPAERHLEQ